VAGERTVRDLSFDESLGYPFRRRSKQGNSARKVAADDDVMCSVSFFILFEIF
jgi:hypothetical protein